MNTTINEYHDNYREQILTVWENSVLATHNFLTPSDFEEIKELVKSIDFNDFQVFCLTNEKLVLGFIGVMNQKIEMLFLDPNYFGHGLGLKLLNFAVKELKANTLDVNEQNTKAIKFYQKFGFQTFERTDKDDQGRNYPLLRMKLAE
ncbi:GNAT family N-acetyltransferase [Sphingobacterium sp. SRCM116780]|uniref:GNAT family N-acetyltransferase n=1 Tax=Sphingobacterium sp. SRCM116780 TaxID=2907623 RepID=UPI001F21E0E4|nr:GNAT family N-acetyltransferase [Sphingobacterium sp. SRCM116780]UIR56869.1 GNAT family N-acetyltransferase [Sphingobacterium sp. SRCM116780]